MAEAYLTLLQSINETKDKAFRENEWGKHHALAMTNPKPGMEAAIVGLLRAWVEYADAHKARYESPIGEDGVLGEPWERIGQSIITLLNGETGRLDCGTIDGLIRKIAREQDATEVIEQ